MSAAFPPVNVQAYTLAGGSRNQDRYIIGEDYAAVLDGASSFDPERVDSGGEYAGLLARALDQELGCGNGLSLSEVLANAIDTVINDSPTSASSTVTMARWGRDVIEILCLGDGVATVIDVEGQAQTWTDSRIEQVATDQRAAFENALRQGRGFTEEHRHMMANIQAQERKHRNQPGGYWIASDDPRAAGEAVCGEVPRGRVQMMVLASDGAAAAVARYGVAASWARSSSDWAGALDAAHVLEESDAHGELWPRSKKHDDKTVVVSEFLLR